MPRRVAVAFYSDADGTVHPVTVKERDRPTNSTETSLWDSLKRTSQRGPRDPGVLRIVRHPKPGTRLSRADERAVRNADARDHRTGTPRREGSCMKHTSNEPPSVRCAREALAHPCEDLDAADDLAATHALLRAVDRARAGRRSLAEDVTELEHQLRRATEPPPRSRRWSTRAMGWEDEGGR